MRRIYDRVCIARKEGVHGGRRVRVGTRGLVFSIHKRDSKLDRLGQVYTEDFETLSWETVLNYVHYEPHANDLFMVGKRAYRQKQGIAIGWLSWRS